MIKRLGLSILLMIALFLGLTACIQQQTEPLFIYLTPEQVEEKSTLVVYGEEVNRESINYDWEAKKLDNKKGLKFDIITIRVLKVIRGDFKEDQPKFYTQDFSSIPENYGKSILYLMDYKALEQEDINALTTSWVLVRPTSYLQNKDGKWTMRYDWKDYLESKNVLTSDASSKSSSVIGDYEVVTQDNLVDLLTNMK